MKIEFDEKVHYPLGGGSYIFKHEFVRHLISDVSDSQIRLSIGAQPNSSPHFGTLVVFNLAFAIGKAVKQILKNSDTRVQFEIVDTAPQKSVEIDGIKYQISLRDSNVDQHFTPQYQEVLEILQKISGIEFETRKQSEFNTQPGILDTLELIMQNRTKIAEILDPEKHLLRMRVACPECGLTDKNGVNNQFSNRILTSSCPVHGKFDTDTMSDSHKLEYNTPLRNLIRAIVYSKFNKKQNIEWIRVTGSDYAGYYQEQFLYRAASAIGVNASDLPKIVYAPLITDWSGAKLSKSLYVKENAYSELPKYLIDYQNFKQRFGAENGIRLLFNEVDEWVKNPYKLFRNYSAYYFINIFGDANI